MVKKYYKYLFLLIFGLFLFIPKDTQALTIYAERFNDERFAIASNDQTYWRVFTSNFNNTWANAGSGYIRFNFSMQKYSGSSTNQVLAPMTATVANTLGNDFPCDIGSISVNNSTYNDQVYSAICPVNFYNGSGLKHIVINFNTNTSTNDPSYYYVVLDGRISFEVPQYIQDNSQAIINSQTQILQEQQQTTQAIEDNTQAIQDVDDTLKDDDVDTENAEDLFEDTDDYSNSPVSDMLTMPITLLQNMLNGINGTCSPVNLGRFGFASNDLILPCIHPQNYLGSTLWGVIDALFSIFMIYNIAMLFIAYYDMILTLGDPFTYLYYKTPIGYEMGGRND